MKVSTRGALAGALALALPALAAAPASAQDVRTLTIGRGVQIGVSVSDVEGDDAKAPKAGVIVDSVSPGGPADKAGIKSGDTITEYDGERVRSVRQFARLVQESAPGHAVAVTLSRGGQRVNVNVTPDRRPGDFDMSLFDFPRAARIPTPPPPPGAAVPRPPAVVVPGPRRLGPLMRLANGRGLGVTIESLDDQLAEYFGVKDGVLVKSVADDSPAKRAGLKAGDVITGFNGSKVYDVSDLTRGIDRLDANADFTVEVMRDRKPQSLKGKLDGQTRRRTRTML